jgi:4-hydroxybenzoate polyprenyltransferase
MLKSFIQKIENSQMSFWQAVLLLYIVFFARGFLENFVNSANQNHITGFIDIFFHYPFWFFSIFLLFFIILTLFTKEKIEKVSRAGVLFSLIILIAPIADLIIYKSKGVAYTFIGGDFSGILYSFLHFMKGIEGQVLGATLGIRIEAFLGLLFLALYIFLKTKEVLVSVAGVFVLYAAMFIFLSLPVFIFEAHNLATGSREVVTLESMGNFYYFQEPVSSLTNHRTFILDLNNYEGLGIQRIKNQYSLTLAIVCLLIVVFLLGFWFRLYDKNKFYAALKNFRFLRILNFFLLTGLGIVLGIAFSKRAPVGSLFDFLSFVTLFSSLLFAWLFSVWENDEADVEIDQISNQSRPLLRGEFSPEEWSSLKYLFLFLSLAFAFLGGLYLFIFILLFLASYHIYSSPPFRLKRFLGVSSLLVAVSALVAVLMGFFMSAGTESLSSFPAKWLFGFLAIVFLAENFKNLKDIEGDRRAGIKTLPVVLGEKRGKLVTGILAFLTLLLFPLVFYFSISTFLAALLFGAVQFFLIIRKNYQEKYVFLTYLVFTAVFCLLTLAGNH